ncbi:MAG: TonB-dependent receptor [Pseudomonadales bacterium]|nr:TonB-dependent receptor [Pseudomonadales bacterium]
MSHHFISKPAQFKLKPIALAVALGTTAGYTSAAQTLALEEIVVTAQKRDQSAQDVPISIGVLGSEQLDNNGVGDLEDFAQLLPSMNYVTLGPGTGNVYMRGISSGGESILGSNPNVSVYMDEQPVTSTGFFLNPHIYDVNRIETLAGPQGTLFGANAQAGAIRIITNQPEPGVFEGGIDVEVNSVTKGGDGHLFEGFVNIPLGESAAIRLVAWSKDEAGFIDNVEGSHTIDYQYIRDGLDPVTQADLIAKAADITLTNETLAEKDFNTAETTGMRAKLAVDLGENWTITAGVMRQELESNGVWDHDPADVGDLEVMRFEADTRSDDWTQLSLVVEGKIGDMTLTYTTSDLEREAYFDTDYSLYSDATLSPGYVSSYYSCYVSYFGDCVDPSIKFTGDMEYGRENHELRLVSGQDSRLRWLVGVFYEEAFHDFDLEWHVLGLAELTTDVTGAGTPAALEEPDIYWTTDQYRSNEETAYFGEITFDITDSVSMAYSTRYFDYDSQLIGFSGTIWWPDRYGPRTEDFNTDLQTNDSDSVSKLNVTYTINNDVMVYGSWSEGYRPGGLNRVYNTVVGGTYDPDFLTSYEAGIKTTLMDGRLRFNAAVYTQEWDNFQLSKIDYSVSVLTLTDNVGNATSDGFEIDGSFLINENWDINFGLSYIQAELSESYWLNSANEGVTDPEAPAGIELPRVPELKWSVTSRYNFELLGLDAFIQGAFTHTGESYNLLYGTSSTRTRDLQDPYQILNLAFGVEQEGWAAEFYVKNVTDERGEVFINGASYDKRVTINRPRTMGLRLKKKF